MLHALAWMRVPGDLTAAAARHGTASEDGSRESCAVVKSPHGAKGSTPSVELMEWDNI